MKENLTKKLTSRKFWLATVTFIVAVVTLFSDKVTSTEHIFALITMGMNAIAYIFGEAITDVTIEMKGE